MTAPLRRPDPASDTVQAAPLANGLLHPLEQIRRQVAASLFDEPHTPSTIGRFLVLRVIGAGGMGVVYAARDPQLDRTVALKLLQPTQLGPAAQHRLLREAQAMARLQHPNVLAVHDAGVHDGQVWLAMEYEGGGTLADWLRAAPRRWPEVVEVLLQAGRGLAAAHAAGLVHRDFKPANVLVGGGRIRISDFGLARLGDDAAAAFERTGDEHAGALAEPMTRTGAVLGTPAYMAPEQLEGGQASARSDQFAFCVVLYEALHGHRPFRGDDLGQLREAFRRGALVRPSSALPRGLQAVLARGLATDPERRFASMDELLAALARVREARPWRRALVGAAVAGVSVMSLQTYVASLSRPASEAAASEATASDPLAHAWGPERARALVDALPGSRAEVEALVATLDAYAARWREVRAERAVGPELDGDWTETCLTDRLRALDDYVTLVSEAMPEVSHMFADAAELLPDVADCVRPSPYDTLISQSPTPRRREAWRSRLLVGGAFVPRPLHAARMPSMGKNFEALMNGRILGDARLELEVDLGGGFLLFHDDSTDANTFRYRDPQTGEYVVHEELPEPPRERTLKSLRDVGARSSAAGFADIAARAWAGVAELLEAGPHAEDERAAVREALLAELAKLPAGHRLRRRLTVDLAVFEAAHARHVAAPGRCSPGDKFGACEVVHRAVDDLALALREELDPARQRWLAEQLARAHELAGDPAAAAEVRGRIAGEPDGRSAIDLGYLDLAAGTVGDAPKLADAIRCTYDHSRCEVDPALIASELEPEALLAGAWFLPAQTEGGYTVMNSVDSPILRHVDIRKNDKIMTVDGLPVPTPEFVWDSALVLLRGRLALTIERDGETLSREFVLRAP